MIMKIIVTMSTVIMMMIMLIMGITMVIRTKNTRTLKMRTINEEGDGNIAESSLINFNSSVVAVNGELKVNSE